ncbi:MAG TPA: hypothetical protein VFX59_19440 [Polyangiales bacterium]|nr:hypothetical protein [Polyangiales bacterium]
MLPTTPDAGAGCATFVSDSLIDHACFHELMGPHLDRVAGAAQGAPSIDVDRAHTAFHVRLPEKAGGGYAGVLAYRPRASGEFAVFTRDGKLRIRQQDQALAPRFTHDTEICAVLPSVSVYALQAQSYTLELESDREHVALIIESMSEGTVQDAYRIACASRPRLDGSTGMLDAHVSDTGASAPDAGSMCPIDPLLEHSCLHALHGPYGDIEAATEGAVPSVDRVHTAWRIALPDASAGRVTFQPTQSGEHVFYLEGAVPLTVRAGGALVPEAYRESVVGCSGLAAAHVYELERGVRHDVSVGPSENGTATLVIENVQSLAVDGWAERFEACD